MLPDIDLDQERFEDIVDEARNRLPGLFPEWTDLNYHDPGITLIELFAWLKEIQQFTMNQVVEQNRRGYFRLLHMEQLHRKPAVAELKVQVREEEVWEKGTAVYAGDISFETKGQFILKAGVNMLTVHQIETVAELMDYTKEKMLIRNTGGMFCLQVRGQTCLSATGSIRLFLKYGEHFYESSYRKIWDGPNLIFEVENLSVEPDLIRLTCYAPQWEGKLVLETEEGKPGQMVETGISDLENESFRMMAAQNQVLYEWECVPDFYHSGPGDRHYLFDETTGTLLFGDGVRGQIPLGAIYVTQAVRTVGSGGNVKAGMIKKLKTDKKNNQNTDLIISNPKPAYGGCDTERAEDTWVRYGKQFKANRRLITTADYEKAVTEIPGLPIESCKVLPSDRPGQVSIVVKPASVQERKALKKKEEQFILNALESRRTVGTTIRLYAPRYAELTLSAGIAVRPQYAEARRQITARIRQYFKEREDEFGAQIYYSDVFGFMNAPDAVYRVDYLNMNIKGTGTRKDESGNLFLPLNGLPVLKDLQLTFYTGGQ